MSWKPVKCFMVSVFAIEHFTIARRGFDSLCFLLNQWVKNNSPLNLPKEEGLAKPSEIQ